jgi:hypothetical protein
MSETTEPGMTRRKLLEAAGTAVAAVAVGALAAPEAAAQQPVDMVPFKVTLTGGPADFFVVPMTPPLVAGRVTLKGVSDLVGEATYVDAHTGHMGLDGTFKRVTDAYAALTGANGDAIFIRWDGLVRSTGLVGVDASFTIVGGKGRFAGAIGDGTMSNSFDPAKQVSTFVYDGRISAPKK